MIPGRVTWRCVHRWTEDVHFSLQPRGGDSHLATPLRADPLPLLWHAHRPSPPPADRLLFLTAPQIDALSPVEQVCDSPDTRTRTGGKLPPRKSTKTKQWVHLNRPAVISAIIPFRRVSNTRRARLIGDQVRINVQFWSVTVVESRYRLLKWSNVIIWHSSDLLSCREINLKWNNTHRNLTETRIHFDSSYWLFENFAWKCELVKPRHLTNCLNWIISV